MRKGEETGVEVVDAPCFSASTIFSSMVLVESLSSWRVAMARDTTGVVDRGAGSTNGTAYMYSPGLHQCSAYLGRRCGSDERIRAWSIEGQHMHHVHRAAEFLKPSSKTTR